ncbi:hypothetical protein LZ32DRAFT_664554 [Colletotrichum eremochloae]|nr:hypothetical protein LZ32DRAFT_664554 [Colletotrichum eremochloae]
MSSSDSDDSDASVTSSGPMNLLLLTVDLQALSHLSMYQPGRNRSSSYQQASLNFSYIYYAVYYTVYYTVYFTVK